jgi:hypothetical protein
VILYLEKNIKDMKLLMIVFLLIAGGAGAGYGQAKAAGGVAGTQTPAGAHVKEQAAAMGQALVQGQYKTFAHYIYPGLVKMMGGEDKMAAQMETIVGGMKQKGMVFLSVKFDEPSAIVHSGVELECTVTQHTEIKVPDGRAVATSTLIAISTDKGVHWGFVDTSNKDMATIKQLLPELSPAIVIPPPVPPVHYNN